MPRTTVRDLLKPTVITVLPIQMKLLQMAMTLTSEEMDTGLKNVTFAIVAR